MYSKVVVTNSLVMKDLFCIHSDCSNLTAVDIPSSVSHLGDYALEGNESKYYLFRTYSLFVMFNFDWSGCSSLTSLVIPTSVSYLGIAGLRGAHHFSDNDRPLVMNFILFIQVAVV